MRLPEISRNAASEINNNAPSGDISSNAASDLRLDLNMST
jgi:hypothetical protein